MKKLIYFASLNLLFCNAAFTQQNMVPETLWKLGRVSDPQISPSGDKIAYTIRTYDLQSNKGNTDIWVYDFTSKSASPAADDSSNESMPRWNKDGSLIYFLNDQGGSSQLWKMKADGSLKEQQTHYKDDINLYGLSPAGNRLWLAMDVKVDRVLGRDKYPDLPKTNGRVYDDLMMRHWDSWSDGSYSHLFIDRIIDGRVEGQPIDIMDDLPYDSPLKPTGGAEEISWKPDGEQIAYTCKKYSGLDYATNTNSDIYLYDIQSKKTENITEGMDGYDKSPCFSPDGLSLSWIRQPEPGNEAARHHLFLYDFKSKHKQDLSPDFDYNVELTSWSADGKKIFFIADIQATDQVFETDLSGKKPVAIRQLTNDIADYTELSIGSRKNKGDVLIASRMSISEPTELFSIDPQSGISTPLTFTNKETLSEIKLAEVKKRLIKSSDGKEILTWVIYPPDFDPTKKYPTLLYCQGGPQSTVSQFFSYRWNFQLMAANGYIVVAPNRRGLPGFGSAWNDEISKDWGGQAMKDLLSAIDDVSKESYVDKDKLGAVGASFGGYSVFWLEGHHEKRFKAFIAHCGVFNMESMLATEELFFYNYENGGYYWNEPKPATYDQFSPNRFIKNWDTPILIISNEKDYRVPYTQGLEAYSAARLQKIPARFLSFPDEGHWVLKPQNSILWQREFFDWLDKYLK